MGETVDFKIVRGEMANLEPCWATGTFLGRTDESDEVIVVTAVGIELARSFRRRTRDRQWQRDAFTTFVGTPWNPRGLAVEAPMVTCSTARRDARLFSLLGSFIAAHGNVPRKIWAADQSKRDRCDSVIPSVVGDPQGSGMRRSPTH